MTQVDRINEEHFTELVRDTILGHSEVTSVCRRPDLPPSYLRNPPNAAKSHSSACVRRNSYSSSVLGLIRRNSAALLLSHAVDGTLAIFLRSQADSLVPHSESHPGENLPKCTNVIVGETLKETTGKETHASNK